MFLKSMIQTILMMIGMCFMIKIINPEQIIMMVTNWEVVLFIGIILFVVLLIHNSCNERDSKRDRLVELDKIIINDIYEMAFNKNNIKDPYICPTELGIIQISFINMEYRWITIKYDDDELMATVNKSMQRLGYRELTDVIEPQNTAKHVAETYKQKENQNDSKDE